MVPVHIRPLLRQNDVFVYFFSYIGEIDIGTGWFSSLTAVPVTRVWAATVPAARAEATVVPVARAGAAAGAGTAVVSVILFSPSSPLEQWIVLNRAR